MRLIEPLNDLFATRSHIRVLRALDALLDGLGVSGREIARRARVSHPTALEVLSSLLDQGVVVVRRAPKVDFYQLNADHVLTAPLRVLFEAERAAPRDLEASIGGALRRVRDVKAAYLFGSAARGDMRVDSDIDIAAVSRRALPEHIDDLQRIYQRFGNRVNVVRLKRVGAIGLRRQIAKDGRSIPLSRTPLRHGLESVRHPSRSLTDR